MFFFVSIPYKGSKKSSSHIMTEEDISHNESISSCSDGEGDGSGHAEGSQPRHGLEEKKKKMKKIIKIILGIL